MDRQPRQRNCIQAARVLSCRVSGANSQMLNGRSRQLISLHPTPHASVIYAQFNDFAAYVLRETGQMIGSEEGISCLWQGILGCGPTAESREVSAFWQDWETRSLRAEL